MPRDKYSPQSAYDSLNLKPVQELSTVPDCGVRMKKPRSYFSALNRKKLSANAL